MKRIVCRVCTKTKPVVEFDLRSDTKKVSSECKECRRERVRVRAREWGRANPERARLKTQQWRRQLREEVLAAYGRACACCGETEPAFLALDHVGEDGAAHRRQLNGVNAGSSAYSVYQDAKRRGFPPDFQLLCHNCNMAKHLLGECPHQTARLAVG